MKENSRCEVQKENGSRKAKTVDRKAKNGRSMRKDHESTVFAQVEDFEMEGYSASGLPHHREAKMPGRVV